MAVRLKDRTYQKTTSFQTEKQHRYTTSLIVRFVIGLVLFTISPLIGLIVCISVGKPLFKELSKQGVIKKDVEGKTSVDWNRAKSTGRRSFDEVRAYSCDTAQKYKTRVSESDRMDEHQPRRHAHTPVTYSYDKCAKDRRLEQIKSLKEAGILDEKEYQQRRADILAGR